MDGRLQLIKLEEHCATLSHVFCETYGHNLEDRWLEIADRLDISTGIESVRIDISKYKCNTYCSEAYKYDSSRDELLSKIVEALTKFTYIWGAVESLIEIINPPIVPGYRGKISRACNFLKQEYRCQPIPKYEECIDILFKLIRKVKHYNFVEGDASFQPYLSISGIGLFTVYRIRNQFMHGTLRFSAPTEWQSYAADDHKIVYASMRILLLTMQMLLIALLSGKDLVIKRYDDHEEERIEDYLQALHIARDMQAMELPLFNK